MEFILEIYRPFQTFYGCSNNALTPLSFVHLNCAHSGPNSVQNVSVPTSLTGPDPLDVDGGTHSAHTYIALCRLLTDGHENMFFKLSYKRVQQRCEAFRALKLKMQRWLGEYFYAGGCFGK